MFFVGEAKIQIVIFFRKYLQYLLQESLFILPN